MDLKTNQMENKKTATRRKFVLGLGILSVLGVFMRPFISKKVIVSCGPVNKKKTVKMLTQEGTLVEIEESMLQGQGKKITDEGLKSWVKKS